MFADSCLKDNGGCDKNAACSHDQSTNAVKCTCKIGYTNVGSESNVTCTGTYSRATQKAHLKGVRELLRDARKPLQFLFDAGQNDQFESVLKNERLMILGA